MKLFNHVCESSDRAYGGGRERDFVMISLKINNSMEIYQNKKTPTLNQILFSHEAPC